MARPCIAFLPGTTTFHSERAGIEGSGKTICSLPGLRNPELDAQNERLDSSLRLQEGETASLFSWMPES